MLDDQRERQRRRPPSPLSPSPIVSYAAMQQRSLSTPDLLSALAVISRRRSMLQPPPPPLPLPSDYVRVDSVMTSIEATTAAAAAAVASSSQPPSSSLASSAAEVEPTHELRVPNGNLLARLSPSSASSSLSFLEGQTQLVKVREPEKKKIASSAFFLFFAFRRAAADRCATRRTKFDAYRSTRWKHGATFCRCRLSAERCSGRTRI